MAQKKYQITEDMEEEVLHLSRVGLSTTVIARRLGWATLHGARVVMAFLKKANGGVRPPRPSGYFLNNPGGKPRCRLCGRPVDALGAPINPRECNFCYWGRELAEIPHRELTMPEGGIFYRVDGSFGRYATAVLKSAHEGWVRFPTRSAIAERLVLLENGRGGLWYKRVGVRLMEQPAVSPPRDGDAYTKESTE